MSVIYVKRSGPEREIRAKNDYLFGEPGNGCALCAAGFCMYEYNEAYVHYYDAWCELFRPASWLYFTKEMCLNFVLFLKEIEIKRRISNIFWKKL